MPFAVSPAQLPRGNVEFNTNYMFLVLEKSNHFSTNSCDIRHGLFGDTLGNDEMAQWLRVLPALAEDLSVMPSTHLAGVSQSPVSSSKVFVGSFTHVHSSSQ